MQKLKVFSVCSGVGGLDEPFINDKENFEVIGFCEYDSHASAVLNYNHEGIVNHGDITKIRMEELPDFDLLTGGTPCTNLSLAGNREGLAGEQSRLFYSFIEILKAKKPRMCLWENVEGAFSSNQGWDFAEIQDCFSEAGYDVFWEVLSATEFSIPQNRKRVFCLGFLRGTCRPEVLFISGENGQNSQIDTNEQSGEKKFIATRHLGRNGSLESDECPTIQSSEIPHIKCIGNIYPNAQVRGRIYDPDGLSPTIQTASGGGAIPHIAIKKYGYIQVNPDKKPGQSENIYDSDGISPTLLSQIGGSSNGSVLIAHSSSGRGENGVEERVNVKDCANTLTKADGCGTDKSQNFVVSFNRKDGIKKEIENAHSLSASDWRGLNRNQDQNAVVENKIIKVHGEAETGKKSQAASVYDSKGVFPSICAGTHGYAMGQIQDGIRIRRLTPLECERLMGWKDQHTRYGKYPDGTIKEISDTQRYKMCGNGVVPQCVEPIKNLIIRINSRVVQRQDTNHGDIV